jgi:hypothetical protein
MKHRQIVILAALLALVFSAASRGQTTTTATAAPNRAAQAPQVKPEDRLIEERKASKFSGPPIIGEFQTQLESEPDRPRRLVRKQRYSASNYPLHVEDPGRLVGGQEEHTAFLFIDSVMVDKPGEPRGIPASVSSAIVVGTVVSGKCFVTADHTYVYTDYSVKVDQILKQDPAAKSIPGDVVVAAREGGAIYFPSGYITNCRIHGRGLPEVGSHYVFFLWRSIPEFPEYEIIFQSGYQLKNGRVYPLDDANSQYVGVEAPVFLDTVKKALRAASQKGVGQ